jgi:hypothetical protein
MKALALLLLGTSGCFVLTGTTQTTQKVGTRTGEATPGKVEHIAVGVAAADGAIDVRAVASRTCTRDRLGVYEVRESKHLRMGGADDPRAKVFGLLLAPVTMPVSFVISGLSVLGSDQVTEATRVEGTERYACTTPAADLAVTLGLPSGEHAQAFTDVQGELHYKIPLAEPYDGVVTVQADKDQIERHDVEYHRPMPALVAAREAMIACNAPAGTLALELDSHGGVAHLTIAGDDGATAICVAQRLSGKHFPYLNRKVELVLGTDPSDPKVAYGSLRIARSCAAIDTRRDELDDAARARAKKTLARVLESEGLLVVDHGCEDPYALWHERVGSRIVVHVASAAGKRNTKIENESDLPEAYEQLAHILADEAQVRWSSNEPRE